MMEEFNSEEIPAVKKCPTFAGTIAARWKLVKN